MPVPGTQPPFVIFLLFCLHSRSLVRTLTPHRLPPLHPGKVRKEGGKTWRPDRSRGHWSCEVRGASFLTGGSLGDLGSVLADAYSAGRPQFPTGGLSVEGSGTFANGSGAESFSSLPPSSTLLSFLLAGLNSLQVSILTTVTQCP